MSKKYRYKIEYAGVLALGALSSMLGQRGRVFVGHLLGRITLPFLARPKKIALGNMRRAFPGWDKRSIDKLFAANTAHLGRVALEFLATRKMRREDFARIVRIENMELVEREKALGKGVILLSPHLGNWEIMGLALTAVKGFPLHALGKRIHNPYVDRMVTKTRERFGTEVVNNRDAARPVLKILKKNEFAGILIDQRPSRGEGVASTFFGQTVATNHGVATLALRSGAPVIFSTCITEGNRYVLRFHKVIDPPPDTGDREARIREFTQAFDGAVEEAVRERPQEWLWMHDRWKLPKGFKP